MKSVVEVSVSKIRMNARRYDDLFPPDVVRAQECWEQVRLCRRLRKAGVDLDDNKAARARLIDDMDRVEEDSAKDPVSPIEHFLAKIEYLNARARVSAMMADPETKARARAEWDRMTTAIDARKRGLLLVANAEKDARREAARIARATKRFAARKEERDE